MLERLFDIFKNEENDGLAACVLVVSHKVVCVLYVVTLYVVSLHSELANQRNCHYVVALL